MTDVKSTCKGTGSGVNREPTRARPPTITGQNQAMRTLPLREIHGDDGPCVRRVPLFSGLTPEQQDVVAALARPMILTRGELAYRAGERSGRLSVVHTGQLKLIRTMPSGRQRVLRIAGPGETLGEQGFLTGDAPFADAEALSDVRLCMFSHEDLAALVSDYPRIAVQMLRSLGERLAMADRRLALAALDVDVRVADYLLEQPLLYNDPGATTASEPAAAGGTRVRLPLSKKDVASMLGTTPESFSRALTRLTSNNLIAVQADVVTLLDPQGLDELVANA